MRRFPNAREAETAPLAARTGRAAAAVNTRASAERKATQGRAGSRGVPSALSRGAANQDAAAEAAGKPQAGSLVARAYDWLKDEIMSDRLAAGQTIDDREIAARLGLSRTPVREAIQMLRVEGFVEVMPRRGTRVAQITLEDLREVYQAITALEVESVILAAARKPSEQELAPLRKAVADMIAARPGTDPTRWIKCDERFHRGLLTLSGNRRIEQVGLGLRDYAQRAHIVASRLRPIPAASEQAHGELLDLIAAGKVEAARKRHSEQRRNGEIALIGAMERAGIRAL